MHGARYIHQSSNRTHIKRTKTYINSCCQTIGLAVIMPIGTHAQEPSPQERIIEIGCKDNHAMKHLDILSNRRGRLRKRACNGGRKTHCRIRWKAEEKRQGPARPKPEKAGDSGHAYFAMNGVPTIGFNLKDPKGYNFSYREIWHTERDTYNMSIPEYKEHTATCTAVILYGLADLDHLLNRDGLYAESKETR